MPKIRPEEEGARHCISASLGGIQVNHHDDNSRPGMYDLEIAYPDRPTGAVEVTMAADHESIQLWNLVNRGDRRTVPGLAGGWVVELLPWARGRRVLTELPALLEQLEQVGMRQFDLKCRNPEDIERAASALGITRLVQGGTDYPGSVYFTLDLPSERSGGLVAESGDPLAGWLSEWLEERGQVDNLDKLIRSGAQERHLFVILPSFNVAPFVVADLLTRSGAPLPTIAPRLPAAVTHVWAMSTWDGGDGMRWSAGAGWERFDNQLAANRN